ncbi:hypothetical protein [Catellatospora citrea]|uniref:Uncharacterized protein n=1 Tax=Catellatospora citrea TaxID=53366 RepID=A0A8J3NXE7_9ACTN|nr:hypothetical protein [Catellatospora citrea]RKE12428.1 hypothetical protein C8E86_7370 [Catellatospora citrea]GIF96340.1 hypothetical protein Cci01nite_14340 [Catellatospora citrea]
MRQLWQTLPLHIERPFHQWRYMTSHRTLIMRSHNRRDPVHGDARFEESIDVVFSGVYAMNTRTHYRELFIASLGDLTEVDGYPEIPEHLRHLFVHLTVSDGTNEGFVVCSNVLVDPVGEFGLRYPGRFRPQ